VTTLPPDSERISAGDSHHARQIAESFGANAERYDRTRPRYPTALIDAVIAASPGRDVLDVGVGTGVSARPFQDAGCTVLGVDPDARMAEFARRAGIEVEIAKFEEWDAAGRSFDIVIAGQTWHWVEPIAGAAKAAAVLRPRGRIALFWNVMQVPTDLADAFAAIYEQALPDSAFGRALNDSMSAYSIMFAKAADAITQEVGFGEPEQWRFDWEKTYSTEEWLEQVPTFGGHNLIPADKLGELLNGIETAVDAVGGSFTMDYAAVVVTASRRTAV
jgi:SAM-dependent methyltransferase